MTKSLTWTQGSSKMITFKITNSICSSNRGLCIQKVKKDDTTEHTSPTNLPIASFVGFFFGGSSSCLGICNEKHHDLSITQHYTSNMECGDFNLQRLSALFGNTSNTTGQTETRMCSDIKFPLLIRPEHNKIAQVLD